jgi:tetratricopeptide (TPR) repeat protein
MRIHAEKRRYGWIVFGVVCVMILILSILQQPDPAQLYKTGLNAAAANDWNMVLQIADRLRRSPQHKAHASLLIGLELQSRNQLERAFVEFSKANSHPETQEDSYFHAGSICYQSRQYRDCIRLLDQCLTWNPDRAEAHRLIAAACYDIGAMGKAIQHLDHVERLSPGDFRPIYMRASILLDSERFGDAAIAFAHAAEHVETGNTVADEILAEWGNCLIRLRRFDEALAVMKNANPWPDVQARRAQASFSLRRFDEARAFAEEALQKEPLHLEASLVAAQCDEHFGDPEKGIRQLKKCLEQSPHQLLLHQRLGDMMASNGQTEDALIHRQRAHQIAELRAQFADMHQAAAIDSSDADLRVKLAELAEQLGEVDLASGWYQAAIGLNPGSLSIRDQWAKFQQRFPELEKNNTRSHSFPDSVSPAAKNESQEF